MINRCRINFKCAIVSQLHNFQQFFMLLNLHGIEDGEIFRVDRVENEATGLKLKEEFTHCSFDDVTA